MMRAFGIVLRSIPYSDSARIVHCFTENDGLVALFARTGKKRVTGHLLNGSFIEFTAKEKAGTDLLTMTDSRWDPKMPTDQLRGEEAALWLFTVELMQKSLRERLILPQLYHRVAAYYAYLSQDAVSLQPLIPLVMVSHDLGLADLEMVFKLTDKTTLQALQTLGIGRNHRIETKDTHSKEAFNLELDRFQQHFGIQQLGSLDLIG